MKRTFLIVVMLIAALSLVSADDQFSVDEMKKGFETFAEEAAAALPMNALIGLNWSDAYIGQLLAFPPNIGAGVTVGATTVPYDTVKPLFDTLNIDDALSGDLAIIKDYGVPIPAIAAEARVGGIALPFDVGLKFATVPKDVVPLLPDDVSLEYLSFGADFRYALIKGNAVLPKLSVGASYNYLEGSVGLQGLLGGTISLTSFEAPDLDNLGTTEEYSVELTNPSLALNWETNVIEAKAQVSKKLLFITPYAGIGVSSGFSSVGGGLAADVTVKDASGTALDPATVEQLISELPDDAPSLETSGFYVEGGDPKAVAMRLYGGVSLNLLFFYLDANAMYNVLGGNWGGSLGVRVQL